MWKPVSAIASAFLSLAFVSAAHAESSDAIIGAIIGAGFGAAIGHSVDGRQGAILGSAIGAVAGTAIASNDDDNRRDYYERRTVNYVPVTQPVYAQPVYAQPVYMQAATYYPAQPIRVIYRADDPRAHGWRQDQREWRNERREYHHRDHHGYQGDRHQDRRWD